jgi:hypothetical protein
MNERDTVLLSYLRDSNITIREKTIVAINNILLLLGPHFQAQRIPAPD